MLKKYDDVFYLTKRAFNIKDKIKSLGSLGLVNPLKHDHLEYHIQKLRQG